MSVEVRECCDCCRDEINLRVDGTVLYRKRVRRFCKPFWPMFSRPEVEWSVVCEECWRAIGSAVSKARAAASRPTGETPEG